MARKLRTRTIRESEGQKRKEVNPMKTKTSLKAGATRVRI